MVMCFTRPKTTQRNFLCHEPALSFLFLSRGEEFAVSEDPGVPGAVLKGVYSSSREGHTCVQEQ